MIRSLMPSLRHCCLAMLLTCCSLATAPAQSEFGFVNTRPSNQPYLSPGESLLRMRVPPGFEVKLFAAEPDIINPISFTVDERGRLWVVECYEYPKRTPVGRKPRDRIKILEDTKGTGRADRVTIWAEGKDLPRFDLATGIEVGHGGAFLGAAPYLLFLRDTKGAGRCDVHEVLLRGFGSQDTHETLNTFQWGPDGRLYGLHGIFTQSKVGDIRLNAAVWRYGMHERKFDIFAEGTSNPWGLDFDSYGQAFLTACVIPHAFHMIPGGTYIRQAGSSLNPYAFGLLREISDHLHHAESGWAHAGALVLQGDAIPPEYQGSLLMGSIHGCSIKRDVLERNGSTFVARHAPDFLVSGDKNFRPINMRWGPDGSIYVIDWHDQNPCHQAAPDSWDMTHGRIYKIQRVGTRSDPSPDLAKKSSRELVELLRDDNPWWHRTALRLLGERRDSSVAPLLEDLALNGKQEAHCLRGLWGLYAVGALDEALGRRILHHESSWVRSWGVRLLGEPGRVSESILERLVQMAEEEQSPNVRLQLASTAGRLRAQNTLPLVHNLMQHKEDARDPCIPLMLWLAYEPRVAVQPGTILEWLKTHAPNNPLVTDEIVPRTVRRLVATGKFEDLTASLAFAGDVKDSAVRRRALEGLVEATENRQLETPQEWKAVSASLLKDEDRLVSRLTRRLAVRFHDLEALRDSMTVAQDARRPVAERIDAIRDLATTQAKEALRPLEEILEREENTELLCEACRGLAAYDDPRIARAVLAGWKRYSSAVRAEVVSLLAGRREWATELLAAVGRKDLLRTDLNNNTILRIRGLRDKQLNAQIESVWGRVRDSTPAELNLLIERMRSTLAESRVSADRGRKVFEDHCAKCHRFEGRGHEVGPNLDGAARDIDYLLINILDPNRVVGQPYYSRFVTLKDGRVETGLLAAEDAQSITLKTENDALKVIPRKSIEGITVQEKSVMPEGLNNNMSVQDFRDLIRYLMANPFLTDVAVAGPFTREEAAAFEHGGPPHAAGLTWSRPVVGVSGRIPLPWSKDEREVSSYVAADVIAPHATHTHFLLGASHRLQVWRNGKLIYVGKPANEPARPDQIAVDVELTEGANHLLFEVRYRGGREALYARFLDPNRSLKYEEAKK
jgi:putative membrane-bound dehydrogenase-like protein